LSVLGAISGNKWLQAIGMVISLGTSIYGGYTTSLAGAAASETASAGAQAAATSALSNVAISQLVYYAFTEMPLQTFMALFAIYKTITTPDVSDGNSVETEKNEDNKRVSFITEGGEQNDGVMQISQLHLRIINI
jgi:hypothetical protein